MPLPQKGKVQQYQKSNRGNFEEKREVSKDFILIFRKNESTTRPIIVITKKIAPKAVARNRIKRLIREVLRSKLKAKGKLKIIVRNDISNLKLAEVSKQLGPQIRKLND